MTPLRVAIAASIASILLLLIVLELIRSRRLRERYALLWLATGIVLLILSAWRGGLNTIAGGIDGVSGGLAPDLRLMDPGAEGDEWYISRTLDGYAQNGVTKMPAYHGILNQEAMWAIRSWIDTKQQ